MRIALLASGSRGDVQPLMVLGDALRLRGHQLTLGTPPNLTGFAAMTGLHLQPIGIDTQAYVQSAQGEALLSSGNARKLMAGFAQVAREHLQLTHQGMLRACEGAEMIVSGVLVADHAAAIAEAKKIPVALVQLAPLGRTRAYPAWPITTRRLPGALNLLTWTLFERLVWKSYATDVNRVRAWLALAPVKARWSRRPGADDVLQIQAYSAALVPGLDDYGTNQPIVGFLRPGAQLRRALGEGTADLDQWLSAGPPPAYFGFGSMPVRDPAAVLRMIEEVSLRLGLRALVSAGWSAFAQRAGAEDRLRVIGAVNHDAVLPRCCVAVHHGGAGSTAASVSAGIPTVVCSVFADQLFWGAQMERLGAGAHLRFASLHTGNLEGALRRVMLPAVVERARALGISLCETSDAAARAADIIEARQRQAAGTR